MITQQIKSNGNLHQPENTLFFIIEEAKETILDFSRRAMKVL